jgi:hypothetical protein
MRRWTSGSPRKFSCTRRLSRYLGRLWPRGGEIPGLRQEIVKVSEAAAKSAAVAEIVSDRFCS